MNIKCSSNVVLFKMILQSNFSKKTVLEKYTYNPRAGLMF